MARDERARDAAGVPAEDHRVVRGLEVAEDEENLDEDEDVGVELKGVSWS